jgi:putative FmdB family regulatory protein
MPLYEYECEACRRRFELIQKFSDPPVERCEICGGAVRKLLSSPAIQFKGSGWYITDYARKGDTSTASSASSGDTGAAKADTKPAAGETKTGSPSD